MNALLKIAFVGCCILAVLSCCVANTARQSIGRSSQKDSSTTVPAGKSDDSAQTAQQSGQGNVSGQVDAHGWTGVEYTTAVPMGQVALMGIMLWLSHRRELLRIQQNGKYVVPLNGSPRA